MVHNLTNCWWHHEDAGFIRPLPSVKVRVRRAAWQPPDLSLMPGAEPKFNKYLSPAMLNWQWANYVLRLQSVCERKLVICKGALGKHRPDQFYAEKNGRLSIYVTSHRYSKYTPKTVRHHHHHHHHPHALWEANEYSSCLPQPARSPSYPGIITATGTRTNLGYEGSTGIITITSLGFWCQTRTPHTHVAHLYDANVNAYSHVHNCVHATAHMNKSQTQNNMNTFVGIIFIYILNTLSHYTHTNTYLYTQRERENFWLHT